MNDKELLEYAALAVGKPSKVVGAKLGLYFLYPDRDGVEKSVCLRQWNPLTSKSDRFELIEKLQMGIDFDSQEVWKWMPDGACTREYWGGDFGDEAHAVLRVAAEIGKRKAGK